MNKMYIAIDGPSASGKGTIAKLLGKRLNLPVLYTGNIYRAIAYKVIETKCNLIDAIGVVKLAKQLKVEDMENPNLVNEKIGQYASIIGAHPQLREATYQFQRDFIESNDGAVIEGRDIGTVICPEANYKFYITSDVEVRAKRRHAQHLGLDYQKILEDLKIRDERDLNRAIAPLKPAKDSIIIDSSLMNVEETMSLILKQLEN